jgi:glutathione synthase/RimK-type ligase-like ATP-grasp enzyme
MRKIAFLTCKKMQDLSIQDPKLSADEDMLIKELTNFDIKVDLVNWHDSHNWADYEFVLIRTTWDYVDRASEFIEVLEKISKQTKLLNPIDTIKWNINKKYLIEIQEMGFKTIPTLLTGPFTKEEFKSSFDKMNKGCGVIVKPTIGASSQGIQLLNNAPDVRAMSEGEWLVQPFQQNIETQGEYSLLFFNKKYSHAITKIPKPGDFRSQEEFDSKIESVSPPKKMILLGESILNKISKHTEYARVDFINDETDNPQIIELELIEPCLFLGHDNEAARSFATHLFSLLS